MGDKRPRAQDMSGWVRRHIQADVERRLLQWWEANVRGASVNNLDSLQRGRVSLHVRRALSVLVPNEEGY
jgi:hypothetical protein